MVQSADFPPHLPIQPTPFIGRDKEVDALHHLLLREDVRLVTLTGPGGVGKTRIALHIAEQLRAHFADGVWFVSLAPISDPDLVIPTIAQTLGLWEAGERSLLEQLQVFLRERQVLLLLDNFEQVVRAARHVPPAHQLLASQSAGHESGGAACASRARVPRADAFAAGS
jgi:predicted ATPase